MVSDENVNHAAQVVLAHLQDQPGIFFLFVDKKLDKLDVKWITASMFLNIFRPIIQLRFGYFEHLGESNFLWKTYLTLFA